MIIPKLDYLISNENQRVVVLTLPSYPSFVSLDPLQIRGHR